MNYTEPNYSVHMHTYSPALLHSLTPKTIEYLNTCTLCKPLDLQVFSGGMSRASYGDKFTVTVMRQEDGEEEQHTVFDLTSKIVDFLVVEGGPDYLLILSEEELGVRGPVLALGAHPGGALHAEHPQQRHNHHHTGDQAGQTTHWLGLRAYSDLGHLKTVKPDKNKPAAQATGADPSQCSFTNRQNPSIHQNLEPVM